MNFNDYYNYINGYNDFNYMTDPNYMMNDLNYQEFISDAKDSKVVDSLEGFKKGNMFTNLYDPYRDYKPMVLKASSEREDMLMQIQELRFAMIDLGLYLDLNDNDQRMVNLFNEYLKKEKELCSMFESKYGPLVFDDKLVKNNWTWDNGPWPWEVQK